MAQGWPAEAIVRALYRTILGRAAESEAVVAEHAARHRDPESLIRAFAESEEAREGRRRQDAARRIDAAGQAAPLERGALRVLLFGAYGNGNLGDAVQAEAVATVLRQSVGRPLDLRACSWIDGAPYPFDPGRIMLPEAIANPWILASFDLLLIGGGGLFGTPHHPLLDPGWIAMLRRSGLPYVLFGVGAARTLPQERALAGAWQALQDGAAFRSGRDGYSLGAMPGAAWLADPVLLAGLRAGGGQPREVATGARPLLIVKRPVHAVEASFLDWASAAGEDFDILAIEPRFEQDLRARYPRLRFVSDFRALEEACASASLVISTRYHGCIAALLAGVPCLGLGAGKNRALFEAVGAPDRCLEHTGPLRDRLAAPPPALPAEAFGPLRAAAEEALARLSALIEALPLRHAG